MSEINIGKHTYQVGKIDAWTSLHVYRRLIPVLSGLMSAMQSSHALENDSDRQSAYMRGLGAMADVLAGMKDEDVDFILKACFKVCSRRDKEHSRWFPVLAPNGSMMFSEDMTAIELFELASATLQSQEGLQAFFSKVADSTIAPAPQASSSQSP